MRFTATSMLHKSWSKKRQRNKTYEKEPSVVWNPNPLISTDLTVQQWTHQKLTGHLAKTLFQILDGQITEEEASVAWTDEWGDRKKKQVMKDHQCPFNRWLTEESWKRQMPSTQSIHWGKHKWPSQHFLDMQILLNKVNLKSAWIAPPAAKHHLKSLLFYW